MAMRNALVFGRADLNRQTHPIYRADTWLPKIAIIALLSSLSGCGPQALDLSTVQDYAKTTAAAATSFDAIADDYYQSCLRRREFAQPATVGNEPLSFEQPLRPPPPTVPKPGQPPQPLDPQAEDSNCDDASDIAYTWAMENDAVVAYVRTLGQVAGVDTAPKNIDSLASALNSAGVIHSDKTASAAGDLATAIVSSLVAARERSAIRQIVQQAHDHGLPQVVAGLQFTARLYVDKLRIERRDVASYYTVVLGSEERQFATSECASTTSTEIHAALHCTAYPNSGRHSRAFTLRAAASAAELRDLIKRQRLERLKAFNAVDSHVAAAQAYSDAIGTIGSGNDALLKAPANDTQGAIAIVKPYVDALHDKVAAMIAALRG